MSRFILVAFAALLFGCPQPMDEAPDAGAVDAGRTDGGRTDAGLAVDAGGDGGTTVDSGVTPDAGRGALVAVLSGAVSGTFPCDGRALDEGATEPIIRIGAGGGMPWLNLQVVCRAGVIPQPGTYTGDIIPPATTPRCTSLVQLALPDAGLGMAWASYVRGSRVSVTIDRVIPILPDAGFYDVEGSATGTLNFEFPPGVDAGAVSFSALF